MKPRDCWPVLANKAQEGVELAQAALARARTKLSQLESSRNKILEMIDEYKTQSHSVQTRLHSMSETTNYRHFISQLHILQEKAEQQVMQARAELVKAQETLMQAQLKKMKMQALLDQDLEAVKRWERKSEQKQLDALGVTLHNLKA